MLCLFNQILTNVGFRDHLEVAIDERSGENYIIWVYIPLWLTIILAPNESFLVACKNERIFQTESYSVKILD